MDDELLTVGEIAATLKMNEQTIRNWIDSGFLPAIRIGRRVRVKHSDFEQLLEDSYTVGSSRRPVAGIWDGEVPAPELPGGASAPDSGGSVSRTTVTRVKCRSIPLTVRRCRRREAGASRTALLTCESPRL
jgi:excisionase family DNA binding protein